MKIASVRIENFRSFRDQTIPLNRFSCFVGPNGAGKSSILAALNVFFSEKTGSAMDTGKLTDEDFFLRNTVEPVRITVTFDDLSNEAQEELRAYARQGEVVVTAEAVFDGESRLGQVRHFGQRLGMEAFRGFFEAEKAGAKATDLSEIYDALRGQFADLPNPPRSKEDKALALREYEDAHPDRCVLIPSQDDFYGVNSAGKLARFIQWVYVPAVKDASEEGQEAKNTALGKLIARAVRGRVNFDSEIADMKAVALARYQELLQQNEDGLQELAASLQQRLKAWAHPDVRLALEWLSDPGKSVVVQQPVAGIKTGEGDFLGSLVRMGHGLQRSYLLALLQELASSEEEDAPTLILACEEPELYQHPPQARHLAAVFSELAEGNSQILVTSHSPLFVRGKGFEDVRLVRRHGQNAPAIVRSLAFTDLCARIRAAQGVDPTREIEGLTAKIHQALQPSLAEMFFTNVLVLVEGLEDVSYITTELHLSESWTEFRRLGCHIVPVNGKNKLIQPLAIARELDIPTFVMFDADGDIEKREHRDKHERDNRALQTLLGIDPVAFPAEDVWGVDHVIWARNLTVAVKEDLGEHYERFAEVTRRNYALEAGLDKHDLFIADLLATASTEGVEVRTLARVCAAILDFAGAQ